MKFGQLVIIALLLCGAGIAYAENSMTQNLNRSPNIAVEDLEVSQSHYYIVCVGGVCYRIPVP